ncbi:hypothetical protein BDM02DRAFT_3126152 [Thelephora ganbajun]|uniref:Uncharacterized protein n=1 Tax=Thelephora ganbajun TaxID=370292 RepID=A0ACB6ZSD9_THEGA|nr:hypothetical protein BDM02DRAFT_3126152 [Thelephora ganbajun]
MFKSAATKLAHNSTIPALAGNSELRPLQEVIATKKLVLQSLQRLSTDFGKSSDALRAWANGEGEDLGLSTRASQDTFSACATLLNHWVSSLASFTSHIAYIRECLKAVRTREEALDEMHRRRKSLMSKADSADKKLNRMSSDHKNLRQQTDLLMSLRDQIRTLDVEIMNEEASLGDWKRVKAREWMGVLFGGLLECSEKGAVVATFGRTIIGYVSTEKTQPGLPRAHYSGHSQVEPLLVEAEQELHKISFIGEVGGGNQQLPNEYRIGDIPGLPPSFPSSPIRPTPRYPQPYASSTLPNNPPTNPHELSDFGEYNPYSQSQTYTPGQRTRLSSFDQQSAVSATKSSSFLPVPPQGGAGFTPGHQPHFSQSSVRSRSDSTPGYPPPIASPAFHPTHPSNNASGSGFIPEHKPSTDDTFSSFVAKAIGESWGLDENRNKEPPRLSVDGPPPSYAINSSSASGPPNPPGPPHIERKPVPAHIQEASDEDDDGVGLSYLNPSNEDGPSRRSDEQRHSGSGFREDRKVRWGSIRDVDAELEKRYSEETRKSHEMRTSVSPSRNPETPSPVYRSRSPSPPMPEPHPHVHRPAQIHPTESPTSIDESQPLPNPNVSVEDEGHSQLDERSLNALAAREISKQMELAPTLPFAGRKSVSPRPSFTNDIPPSNNDGKFGQISSPVPPPPQFTNSTLNYDSTPPPHPPQPPQLQPPPPPPVDTLPLSKNMDSTVSDLTQPDDAYHTPPEYLRNSPTLPSPSITPTLPPPVPQMAATLSSTPPTPTTTKKIPAAAFRRPGMRGLSSNTNLRNDSPRQDSRSVGFRQSPGRSPSRERGGEENGDGGLDNIVPPLNLRKKSLPAIPGVSTGLLSGPRGPGAPRSISSPFPNLRTSEEQPLGPGRVPPLSSSPEFRPLELTFGGGDDDFDYVSAYLSEDDRRQSVVHNGATDGHGHVGGGPETSPPQSEGYGSGRFATRLDD